MRSPKGPDNRKLVGGRGSGLSRFDARWISKVWLGSCSYSSARLVTAGCCADEHTIFLLPKSSPCPDSLHLLSPLLASLAPPQYFLYLTLLHLSLSSSSWARALLPQSPSYLSIAPRAFQAPPPLPPLSSSTPPLVCPSSPSLARLFPWNPLTSLSGRPLPPSSLAASSSRRRCACFPPGDFPGTTSPSVHWSKRRVTSRGSPHPAACAKGGKGRPSQARGCRNAGPLGHPAPFHPPFPLGYFLVFLFLPSSSPPTSASPALSSSLLPSASLFPPLQPPPAPSSLLFCSSPPSSLYL